MQANFYGTDFDNLYITKPRERIINETIAKLNKTIETKSLEIIELATDLDTNISNYMELLVDSMKYKFFDLNIVSDISNALTKYREADYEGLSSFLTDEKINELSTHIFDAEQIYVGDNIVEQQILYDISFAANNTATLVYNHDKEMFETYKNVFFKILDGLKHSVNNYKNCKLIEEENQDLKESNQDYKDILDNRELLEEYYAKRSNLSGGIKVGFDLSKLTYTLLPQIEVYLCRHGAPPNGVFSSELMAPIVQELIDGNILEPCE